MNRLLAVLDRFQGRRVLVAGDLMLDEYLRGTVRRVSPEAPVPVVDITQRTSALGGAGNVAANLRAMGADVAVAGLAGDDDAGREVLRLLTAAGIDCSGVLTLAGRPTTTKTRIVAQQQQIARVDREVSDELGIEDATTFTGLALRQLGTCDALLLQDYDKGALGQTMVPALMDAARAQGKIVTVDPKRSRFFAYRGATLFKPNLREAEEALGWQIHGEADQDRAGEELLQRLEAAIVMLTLGEHGMAIYQHGLPVTRVPARATREVFDVSGAGDTVISAATLALLAGADPIDAAHLASIAAGLKVAKLGAVPVNRDELRNALEWDGR